MARPYRVASYRDRVTRVTIPVVEAAVAEVVPLVGVPLAEAAGAEAAEMEAVQLLLALLARVVVVPRMIQGC